MDTKQLTKFPKVKQNTTYSCGPACISSICKYFNISKYTQKDIIKKCGSTPDKGTTPEELSDCLQEMGFKTYRHNNMGIDLLKKYIKLKIPVICAIQAHGKKEDKESLECGHYIVVTGYDKDKFKFQDPYTANQENLNEKDFINCWKDKDTKGKMYYQLGIAVEGKK